MEVIIAKQQCPVCPSSDGFERYPDGHGHCFVCGYHEDPRASYKADHPTEVAEERKFTPLTTVFRELKARGISREAVQRYGIDVNAGDGPMVARYPVYRAGEHVGNKVRTKDKEFYYEGSAKDLDLFGQQAFPAGSAKSITIVEGQDDAPAAFDLNGRRYPVVSVHSSSSALADCKRSYEYLNSFDEIVVCFDRDEDKVDANGKVTHPGQDAAVKVASLFKPGKVRVLTLREHKDPNDYLRAGKARQFESEWWKAPPYKPDGLKFGPQMWEEIVNRPNHFTVQYPIQGLNDMTYGIRLSEAIIITADTGVGKTSIVKEIEYKLLTDPEVIAKGYGVGFLHLEEPNHDTMLGLMSVHDSRPYHLPDTERDMEMMRAAYDAVINNDRVVVWDHFGSNSVDAVLDKVRHMHALGCKYIVLDHLSIVVSDQSGDERKQLDEISTKLKTLCMELNIALIAVIHQNRAGQIRGTAGVEQLANIVMKLEREKTAINPWRRNVTKITIEKNRFSGKSGPAGYVYYNDRTGRLEELTSEEIADYEAGNDRRDDQIAF